MERIVIMMQRPGDGAEVRATIEPDGTVTLHVLGARGAECRSLTAAMESDLGAVKARRHDPAANARETETIDRLMRQPGGGWCG